MYRDINDIHVLCRSKKKHEHETKCKHPGVVNCNICGCHIHVALIFAFLYQCHSLYTNNNT